MLIAHEIHFRTLIIIVICLSAVRQTLCILFLCFYIPAIACIPLPQLFLFISGGTARISDSFGCLGLRHPIGCSAIKFYDAAVVFYKV